MLRGPFLTIATTISTTPLLPSNLAWLISQPGRLIQCIGFVTLLMIAEDKVEVNTDLGRLRVDCGILHLAPWEKAVNGESIVFPSSVSFFKHAQQVRQNIRTSYGRYSRQHHNPSLAFPSLNSHVHSQDSCSWIQDEEPLDPCPHGPTAFDYRCALLFPTPCHQWQRDARVAVRAQA